jgi:uncharacterized membrane protein YjjB (DUF3815 family)
MIPGGFATKAILGLFAVTAHDYPATSEALATAVQNGLRVSFIMGALGTGLAIPNVLFRSRGMPGSGRKAPKT